VAVRVAIIVVLVLGAVLWFALVCHCRGSFRRVASKAALTCARTTLCSSSPACPSHISSSYFHGSSSKPSLPIPLHHLHQLIVDISATTRGTMYHPSAFTIPTTTVVVGSRCVYAYDCLPNMRHQTDFLTYHTSTVHPTKKYPFIFWLFSKSTIPSLLALANRSTPSSSRHPTPRFWLTNRMMEGYAITSCTSSLLPLARQNVNMTDPLPSLTPLSPFCLRLPLRHARTLPIRSFGFAGECLGQHSGSDQEANLGDGHGYRASTVLSSSPLYILIFLSFQVNETAVIRYDYGDPTLGTCKETVQGGNHFRYWIQSGSSADRYYFYMSPFVPLDVAHILVSLQSGAIFMAVSYELPVQCEHVTRFPLVCTHLTLTPLCQSGSRHHFQWVGALPS
jgi:hypothetical protein